MNAGMMNIVMIVAMFAIFYFLLIRPQQKRQKAVAQMQSKLKNRGFTRYNRISR